MPMDATQPAPGARWTVLACALAGCALALAFHLHTGFVNDDALITIRYAENAARGDGLVYNVGERVLGTTTPLWALLLTGAAAAGLDPVAVASALGICAHGAAAGLTALLLAGRRFPVRCQLAGGGLVASLPGLLSFAGSGMETSLNVAWIAAFLVLFERAAWRSLGVIGGLAVLTRPDAGLVLAAAGLVHVVSARTLRPFLRAAPGFAIVVVPWLVAAGIYYGSPLPNSGFAKRLQVEDWGSYAALLGRVFGAHGPVVALAAIGAAAAATAPSRSLPLVALVATAAGMHLGGMPGCGWYAPPVLYLAAVLAADGAAQADAAFSAAGRRALAIGALAAPCLAAVTLPDVARDTKTGQAGVERCHGRVGTWLREHAPPGVSVGVDNIGYIGRRSGLRVVDMLGLVQPATAEAIARGERDFALRHHEPELIAVWSRRGNTWKYMPDQAWLDAHGYRQVFEALLYDHYPAGPAYVVWSRVPLRNP